MRFKIPEPKPSDPNRVTPDLTVTVEGAGSFGDPVPGVGSKESVAVLPAVLGARVGDATAAVAVATASPVEDSNLIQLEYSVAMSSASAVDELILT
jgi:hypothetical protein